MAAEFVLALRHHHSGVLPDTQATSSSAMHRLLRPLRRSVFAIGMPPWLREVTAYPAPCEPTALGGRKNPQKVETYTDVS